MTQTSKITLEEIQNFEGKYPKQLWYLFLVEMWERFCFYGMRGVLAIFMADQLLGLAFSDKEANLKYGAIQAFVYAFTFVGGVFADKILGFKKSLVFGGIVMVLGNLLRSICRTKHYNTIKIIKIAYFASEGHYEVPSEYKPHNQPLQITGRSDAVIRTQADLLNMTKKVDLAIDEKKLNESSPYTGLHWRKAVALSYNSSKKWLNQQENKSLKLAIIILVGCLVTMFWYVNAQVRVIQNMSQVNFPFISRYN